MKKKKGGDMEKLARPSVWKIKPYIPGKPIEEVKRELGIEGEIIKLASNENPLGPSPKAIEALKRAVEEVHLYPDDTCYYLKKKLASRLGVEENMIFVGSGSVEIIHYITTAFLNPGERVIMGKPSFIMGKIESQIMEGEVVEVEAKNYTTDIDGMIKEMSEKTKIVYLDNPNNPLGSMVKKEDVEKLVKSAPEDTIVVIDEAYHEYIDRTKTPDSVGYIREGRNVIVLRTFSKIYGLAGLRIGYAISKPEIIDVLNRVRLPFNVGRLSQIAALAALDDEEHVERSRKLVEKEREFLYQEFEKLEIPYIRSETNFITIDTGKDGQEVFKELQRRGVIVRPLTPYGLPTHIRITIGTHEQNIKLMEALREVL